MDLCFLGYTLNYLYYLNKHKSFCDQLFLKGMLRNLFKVPRPCYYPDLISRNKFTYENPGNDIYLFHMWSESVLIIFIKLNTLKGMIYLEMKNCKTLKKDKNKIVSVKKCKIVHSQKEKKRTKILKS